MAQAALRKTATLQASKYRAAEKTVKLLTSIQQPLSRQQSLELAESQKMYSSMRADYQRGGAL